MAYINQNYVNNGIQCLVCEKFSSFSEDQVDEMQQHLYLAHGLVQAVYED